MSLMLNRKLEIILFSCLGFSGFFALFSLIFYFGDWPKLLGVAAMGAFVGLVAAPEFSPKSFKRAWLLQLSSGCVAGLILSILYTNDVQIIAAGTIVGGGIGWLTPYWINHVQVP